MDRLTMLAAATAIAAIVAVGCGDDSDGSSGSVTVTTSSLGKAEFVKQANRACLSERSKLPSRVLKYEEQADVVGDDIAKRYTGIVKVALLPTVEDEIEKVRALGAPAGDEESVESMLSAQLQAVEEAKQVKQVEFPDGLQKYFAEPRSLLEDYGLSECSINFTLSPANAAAAEG